MPADPNMPMPADTIAQLQSALRLVDRIAGTASAPIPRPDAGYATAGRIARRRHDALAVETAAFAAEGIAILLRQAPAGVARAAAAARLAMEMRDGMAEMARALGAQPGG